MSDTLQIRRGLKEHLPQEAREGELLLCTDTKELYVGVNGSVENVAMQSDIVIDTDIPLPATIGGLQKGTVLKNAPIQEVLMQLLYPYTSPLINLTTNQPNLNESGLTLTNTTFVAKLTRRMHPILSAKLSKNGKLLQEWSSILSDFETPATLIYSDNVPLITNTLYELEVQDEKQITKSTLAINFELPVFIGICSGATPGTSEIGNATKSIRSKMSFSHLFTTNNARMMFIYPASWGVLTSIKDVNLFDITNSFTRSEISYATGAGINTYYAYVSNLTTVKNFKVSFNY